MISIFDYQKKDLERIKLIREVNDSPFKKAKEEASNKINELRKKSFNLEKDATKLTNLYEETKKAYDKLFDEFNALTKGSVDQSIDGLSKAIEKANTLSIELANIQKKLMVLAESGEKICNEFKKTKKLAYDARIEYENAKNGHDKVRANIEPKVVALENELKSMQSGLDKKQFDKYQQLKQDKIMPVYVYGLGNSCGGCRTELPSSMLEKLKRDGYLECEHCRRIIVNKD